MSTLPTNGAITNRVSLNIPPDVLQAARDGLQAAIDALSPYLVTLDVAERKRLLKAGPRTSDFVDRAVFYARELSPCLPTYLVADEFARDAQADEVLGTLQRLLLALGEQVEGTLLQSAAEALEQAYAVYAALKIAAQRGSADAKAAVDDLSTRLGRRGANRRNTRAVSPPPGGTTPASGT